eukprot:194596_1
MAMMVIRRVAMRMGVGGGSRSCGSIRAAVNLFCFGKSLQIDQARIGSSEVEEEEDSQESLEDVLYRLNRLPPLEEADSFIEPKSEVDADHDKKHWHDLREKSKRFNTSCDRKYRRIYHLNKSKIDGNSRYKHRYEKAILRKTWKAFKWHDEIGDEVRKEIRDIVDEICKRVPIKYGLRIAALLEKYQHRIGRFKYDIGAMPGVEYRTRLKKKIRLKYRKPYIPSVADLLAKFDGKTIFSTFDVLKAINNIKVAPESQHLTAFSTKYGTFCWTRMAFGGTSAPACWARASDMAFKKCIDMIKYVDDDIRVDEDVSPRM